MTASLDAEVIIVGGGPAGLATAIHLVHQDPTWAHRVLVVEKARYPRPKLCGGGITRPGLTLLREWELPLPPHHVPVRRVYFRYQRQNYRLESDPIFVVVARDAFDAWLAAEARSRGVTILEGWQVTDVRVDEEGVEVASPHGRLRARALVAADGSNSVVRQRLQWGPGNRALLLEVITPTQPGEAALLQDTALFDWSVLDDGVQGYYWDFPLPAGRKNLVNRGLFHSRFYPHRPHPRLPQVLARMLSQRQLTLRKDMLKGHPLHWYSPQAPLARPRVLLAGDAAGADPLLGEGISFALAYGQVAAETLASAFAAGDFRFADYPHRVREHWLLRQLRARHLGAAIAFGSMRFAWAQRGLWRAAPFLFRLMTSIRPTYFPLDQRRLYPAS